MCMPRDCEATRMTAMLVCGTGMVCFGMSGGHEYVGGTCGSGIHCVLRS